MLTLPLCASSLAVAASVNSGEVPWPDCDPKRDGHYPYNGTASGPFSPVHRVNGSFDGSPLFALFPGVQNLPGKTPLLVFMHGTAAKWQMYGPNLVNYASHGFTVVFPYIKSPEADCCQRPIPPTNTNGKFILNGIKWAKTVSQINHSHPLFERIDLGRIVIAGHSMGATCAIMAGAKLAVTSGVINASAIKLVSSQHPGICGPFGPPPYPSTWLKSDLVKVAQHFPILFTTAENDNAFWPAPQTAVHERGCFEKALGSESVNTTVVDATFVEFTTNACLQDGARLPYDDSGHHCPFKTGVETPWLLTFSKMFAQQEGKSAACAREIARIRAGFGVKSVVHFGSR